MNHQSRAPLAVLVCAALLAASGSASAHVRDLTHDGRPDLLLHESPLKIAAGLGNGTFESRSL